MKSVIVAITERRLTENVGGGAKETRAMMSQRVHMVLSEQRVSSFSSVDDGVCAARSRPALLQL